MTKKLLVYLDDDRHEDLKELAHRHKTTMADLIRYALEETFEDQLDAMRGQRLLEEHLRDPSGSMSLDDYVKETGIALPERAQKRGGSRSKAVAG
ncbi:MAG TPA: DUF6290 family protein [Dehalococcoidia bacterium]|nr:DUF6290 family protein [Dehalococcoidia bacterium]